MERTRRGTALMLLAAAAIVAGYAFDRIAPVLLAVVLLGYLTYARLRFSALLDEARIEAKATPPRSTAFQGETVRTGYRLRIRPPGLKIGFSLPTGDDLAVEEIASKEVDVWPGGAIYEVDATVRPNRRGRHRIDALHVDLEDPDRLFRRRLAAKVSTEFTAHASRSAIQEGAQVSELEALVVPDQPETGEWSLEVLTHRPYRPSDRDREIDWKASARYDEMLSRIFKREVERPLVILLDAGREMRYKQGERSMLDHASEFASALARGAHDAGKAVGFAAYDEHSVLAHRRPSSDRTVPRQINRQIAELPDPIELPPDELVVLEAGQHDRSNREEPTDFEQAIAPFLGGTTRVPNGLARAVQVLGDRTEPSTFLVFTPLLNRPSEAIEILHRLTRHQHRVIVGAPFAPFYLTGREGRDLSPDTLERVHEAWEAHRERMARVRAIGGTVVDLVPELAPRELVRTAKGASR